jgi:lipoprotein-anchoring transpeptidase ErfK/SrfK
MPGSDGARIVVEKTELSKLAALMLGFLSLSSCQIPPDTGATDPDRFVQETNPVWARPIVAGPVSDADAAPSDDAGFPVRRMLAGRTLSRNPGHPVDAWSIYNPRDDDGHWLPAIPVDKVDSRFLRQEVRYDGHEAAGTIVVDTEARFLYFVMGHGRAMRYGVGIGRQGYLWKGRGIIASRAKWPRWTPSDGMVESQPGLRPFSIKQGGLVGGLNNPLGARALYISQDGADTLYRVHGTPDWKSIGREVSSGCVRMFNQDVIDLHARVRPGAAIIVR